MTTHVIYVAWPNAGGSNVGYAAPTPSGLSINDATTGSGITKALLDDQVGSTALIKLSKLLAEFQRTDKYGRKWMSSSDGGVTFLQPLL